MASRPNRVAVALVSAFVGLPFIVGPPSAYAGGLAWTSPSALASTDADRVFTQVASTGNITVTAWQDNSYDNPYGERNTEIVARSSDDSGRTWGAATNVSSTPYGDWDPELAASGSAVVGVWGEDSASSRCFGCPTNVVFGRFDGSSWTTTSQPVSSHPGGNRLAASGTNAYYVSGDDGWLFAASTDDGRSWSQPTQAAGLSAGPGRRSTFPDVAADGSQVVVIWRDGRDGRSQSELYARASSDGGQSWQADVRITDSPYAELPASLIWHRTAVLAAWITLTGTNASTLSASTSSDSGRTWTPPATVASFSDAAYGNWGAASARPVVLSTQSGFEIYTWAGAIRRFTSSDGLTWQTSSAVPGLSALQIDVSAVDSGRVAVGYLRSASNNTPAVSVGTVDDNPPDTVIGHSPTSPSGGRVSFSFSSSEPSSGFACSLDRGASRPCTSPQAYPGLSTGTHAFEVAAIDSVGNVDMTPARVQWAVDATPPNTSIKSHPQGNTTSKTATFRFASTESRSSFRCSFDGGRLSVCNSPLTRRNLQSGSHRFAVRAVDSVGNADATPVAFKWTIK